MRPPDQSSDPKKFDIDESKKTGSDPSFTIQTTPNILEASDNAWLEGTRVLQRNLIRQLQEARASFREGRLIGQMRQQVIREVTEKYVMFLRQEAKLTSEIALQARKTYLEKELVTIKSRIRKELADITGKSIREINGVFQSHVSQIDSEELRNAYATHIINKIFELMGMEPITVVDSSDDLQIEPDTKNAHVWNELGNIYFNTGVYDDAVVAYSKAIQLDRCFAWPYSNLALTYVQKGRFTEAILLYQRSIELFASEKDKAISWNRLGNVYRRLNNYDNAISAYQRADELDPENTTPSIQSRFSLLGNYSTDQTPNQVSQAEEGQQDPMSEALREPPTFVDSSGDLQIEMDTKNAHVWNELGNIYFNTGAYDDAIVAYSKAIQLDRLFAWPYSNLALTYVQNGRFTEAILLYQRSIELFVSEKDKAISWNRLGNVYRRLNNYDNAISAYQRADELDPENTTPSIQSRFSLLGNYDSESKTEVP